MSRGELDRYKEDWMKKTGLFFALLLWSFTLAYAADPTGWDGVEKVFAQKGKVQDDMLKLTFPRSDLSVKVGEVKMEPALGLTSWIGFKKTGDNAMMMGDLVLLENEVPLVVSKLVAEGLNVTAIHNHLIGSRPVLLYLHFSGEGKAEVLAAAMRSALAVTATPLTSPAPAKATAQPDWSKVEKIFGKPGDKKGNVLQMSFVRKEKITEKGMEVPPFMGVGSPINLQMVGSKAASTGDFVLVASEVNPVIKALVEHGIAVTAVHSHMLYESPHLFFLHFWGYDKPEKLAVGLKAALGKVNIAK